MKKIIKTPDNVYYTLEHSPFKKTVNQITFFFSSESRLNRFIDIYEEEVQRINTSLSNRFDLKITFDAIGLIKAYQKAETRGFYLEIEKEGHPWHDTLTFDGDIVISKNLQE